QPLLAKDVSFQLSFAATLGLMTLAPTLRARAEAMIVRWPTVAGLPLTRPTIELMAITLAAIAFTLPITAVNFGRISIIAPLANLLAVPAFVAVIITAAVTAVVGLFQPAADLLVWLAWPPVAYMIVVVDLLADLPFASLELRGVGVGHAIAYYAALAGGVWLLSRPRRQPGPARGLPRLPPLAWPRFLPWQGVALALALGSALLWLSISAPAGGRLSATFLDVGQGDAILIRGPQGHTVLVDGGPSGEAVLTALGRHLPFWDDSLDLVVLTHADADHLTGLLAILDRYDVGAVLAGPPEADSAEYEAWRRLIAEKEVPYQQVQGGDGIDLGQGARILILHPPPTPLAGTGSDANNNSLVLRLVMGRASILLTADLETEGEFALLAESPSLHSVAFQVPHHGSRTSSSLELLRDVQPLVAVVSVGADNRYGHPSPDVLERLPSKRIYRTDLYGDITVSSDGHKLWMETQRAP
ncbi:MAG: ComEC/Rec2 family competence protein, partial [Dehalococcoidia bacterium]